MKHQLVRSFPLPGISLRDYDIQDGAAVAFLVHVDSDVAVRRGAVGLRLSRKGLQGQAEERRQRGGP